MRNSKKILNIPVIKKIKIKIRAFLRFTMCKVIKNVIIPKIIFLYTSKNADILEERITDKLWVRKKKRTKKESVLSIFIAFLLI